MVHTPFSFPDLAPCDFFILGIVLKRHCFGTTENMKTNSLKAFQNHKSIIRTKKNGSVTF